MNTFLIKVLTTGIKLAAGIGAAVFIQSEKDKKDTQNSVNNIHEPPTPSNHEDLEYPENIPPEWQQWKTVYRRFTERPPIKHQDIYVPDYLWEIKTVEIPKISMTEREAETFGYSFRKKSKRIRITNYHGSEKSIIIPTYIGGILVNDIGANAFTNSCAERVAIPDNIKKLGDLAFAESGVQFVIFGKGVRVIPKMCFYNCKMLEVAAIPPLTEKLGEKAFFGCGSLKYIELPWELREIGEDCFCGSGLEGFAARFRGNFYPDGSAFANTPLHQNNDLILYRRYDPSNDRDEMTVLLVGRDVNVNFKADRVCLGKNSVCASCRLDFTRCEYLDADRAFKYIPDHFGSRIHITVSENMTLPSSFPDYVDVQCSGGKYKGWYEKLEEDSSRSSLKLKINCSLCTHSLSTYDLYYTRELTLVSGGFHGITILDRAIRCSHLCRVEFTGKFDLYWDSCIFEQNCISLHEVRWEKYITRWDGEDKTALVQFIPSGYAVRPDVHRELLKAFHGNICGDIFDPKIIENIFDNGVIRELSKTRMPLSRREKILLAVDVLKSSPELYPDGTEKYSRFLKRNINYARNMCNRLPREVSGYRNFVMNSRWDKP